MRLYIAGPMTGLPQFNYPAFINMAEDLRIFGHDVVSPAELDDPDDKAAALASPDGAMLSYTEGTSKTWGDFLARDVKLLADDGIEGIVVLPGWTKSRGARLETYVGNALCGLPVFTWDWEYAELRMVSSLVLIRAWANDQNIYFEHSFGVDPRVSTRYA